MSTQAQSGATITPDQGGGGPPPPLTPHAPTHRPQTGADPLSTGAAGTIAVGDASAVGTGDAFSRDDHRHALPAPGLPAAQVIGAGTAGVSAKVAREDHVHPEAAIAPLAHASTHAPQTGSDPLATATAGAIAVADTAATGTADSLARSDHRHSLAAPALPAAQVIGAGTAGVSAKVAREDHVHPMSAAGSVQGVSGFRLTPTTGVPLPTSDVASATIIYCTPYTHNQIALYDGATWALLASAEVSYTLAGRTADLPFDVFAANIAGVLTLEVLNWTSATARATALVRQDGVWCKTGDLTRRYLGTCRPRSATTYAWLTVGANTPAKLDLWNCINRRPIHFQVSTTNATWTYSTATIRQSQGSTNYQFDLVVGLAEDSALLTNNQIASADSVAYRAVGIGYDSTTAITGTGGGRNESDASERNHMTCSLAHQPAIGRHFYAMLEYYDTPGTGTWYASGTGYLSGLSGIWYA